MVSLSGAVVQKGDFRLGPLDLVVEWGARVAVTGRNGAGKTTLVETVLGPRLSRASGTWDRASCPASWLSTVPAWCPPTALLPARPSGS